MDLCIDFVRLICNLMMNNSNISFWSRYKIFFDGWNIKHSLVQTFQWGIAIQKIWSHYLLLPNLEPISKKEILPDWFISRNKIPRRFCNQIFQIFIIFWKWMINQVFLEFFFLSFIIISEESTELNS